MDSAVECFSDDIVLEDTLYVDPIQGKYALLSQKAAVAAQIPPEWKNVIDDIVEDPTNGNIGVRWHLEVGSGAITGRVVA
jgi:hypothetical protein